MLCSQCPRKCGAERNETEGFGYCRCPALPKLARAALHFWEEPPISGTKGSGAIFFSGCALGCVFCQNAEISHGGKGYVVTVERLREIADELIAQGAHNINLVNPTHYAHIIREAFGGPYKPSVPIVYNSGGYESIETLRSLEGIVDVYLPDLKYHSPELSGKYAGAPDYFEKTSAAIQEMCRQCLPVKTENGLMKRGVIVRHLILPGCIKDTLSLLSWSIKNLPAETLYSIMAQYTPCGEAAEGKYPELGRKITPEEFTRVRAFLGRHDMQGFVQELEAAGEEFIPIFDGSGVFRSKAE